MSIAAFVSAVQATKLALGVGKGIILSGSTLDAALLKGELSGMMDALFDVKQHLRDLGDEIEEKDDRIKELELRLTATGRTVRYLNARYHVNDAGEPTGIAYCVTCWAMDTKLIPLTMTPSCARSGHYCCGCKNTIDIRSSPLAVDNYIKSNKEAATNMNMKFKIEVYD